MVLSHGSVEGEYKEGREYVRSRTAEKYMNTDAIDVEDRAAGTRMYDASLYIWSCDCQVEIVPLSLLCMCLTNRYYAVFNL